MPIRQEIIESRRFGRKVIHSRELEVGETVVLARQRGGVDIVSLVTVESPRSVRVLEHRLNHDLPQVRQELLEDEEVRLKGDSKRVIFTKE